MRMLTLWVMLTAACVAHAQSGCPTATGAQTFAVNSAQSWQIIWCNPTAGTVNLYQSNAPCAAGVPFALVGNTKAAGPYDLAKLPAGSYCFYVEAVDAAGTRSAPSNLLDVTVTQYTPPQPPVITGAAVTGGPK